MDITVYDKLYEALKVALEEFNTQSGFGATIKQFVPTDQTYPLIVFTEVRNQPQTHYYSRREQVSSLGYSVVIQSKTLLVKKQGEKTKKEVNKQQICRELMKFITDFMQMKIGLNLISKNEFDRLGTQGELYQITLVFQQNYFENREYFF